MTVGAGLDTVQERYTVLYYGLEGSAKTTHALRMANLSETGKVMLIDAEGGAKPTPLAAQGVPLDRIKVWPEDGDLSRISFESIENEVYIPMRKELEEARAAGEPDPWIGTVMDSYTEIATRFNRIAANESGERDRARGKQRGRFQINVEDYGTATQMLRQLTRMFRDLGLHLALTALERRDVDEDSGVVTYGPALGPSAATDVAGMSDIVVWTRAEELGPNATPFMTGTVRPRESHRAKDRIGMLPTRMIDPSFDRIVQYNTGALVKQDDERHQAAIVASRPT